MSQKYEYFGKYILLEKLATGGMAEVFLARTPDVGGVSKFVAIKRILPQFSDNPDFIEMFKGEAKIAINLSHSNIVSIYEFGMDKGQLFLVMDYVEGRNLRQILNKLKSSNKVFSTDQVTYMVKQVAAGLDHAHRSVNSSTGKPLNITHRDISPQNVMVSFEGEVKVVDFGIAKAETQIETTRTGTLKGKFGYMSPEQAEGQPTDLRTDIFSLGIVLWELIANERLFTAKNEMGILRKIRDCQIPNLRKINPNIDPELERITLKALARDRNLRYQTAAALHRDLNRFLNRQYPDFSPHDFSVFVKTLYATEVLENRKRLIEYARIEFSSTTNQTDSDDRTIVMTQSAVQPQQSLPDLSSASEAAITLSKTLTDTDAAPSDAIRPEQTATSTEALPGPFSQDPGSEPQSDTFTGLSVLDKTSLNRSAEELLVKDNPSPARGPRQSVVEEDDFELEDDFSSSQRRLSARRTKSGGVAGTLFTGILVMAVLVTSYAVLCRFIPQQMGLIAQAVAPLLPNDINVALHGDELYKNLTSTGPQPQNTNTQNPHVTTQNPTGNAQPTPTPRPVEPNSNTNSQTIAAVPSPSNNTDYVTTPKVDGATLTPPTETAASEKIPLVVNSNPSGAEIWINGVNTSETTPARIYVPAGNQFNIALKKDKYITYSRPIMDARQVGRSFHATLQKAMVGYLHIDVKPLEMLEFSSTANT